MEQQSVLNCLDGRSYHLKMSWNEKIKETEHVFPIQFTAIDRQSGRPIKLPKDIATYALGDPAENLGEKTRLSYGGSREAMVAHFLEIAYRRVTDWINRGK
jgi:hypothetical protein